MTAKLENVPVLEGWVNLVEAAEIVGISRGHGYKRAKLASEGKPGGWKTLHRVGTKPMYVVKVSELQAELAEKAEKEAAEEEPK